MRDKRTERVLIVALVLLVLSSVAIYALPNASGGYTPTLPMRVDPPEDMHVWQGLSYWNNLAYPGKNVFVIDRTNPQVTWEVGPWGARGPYPGTDHWVVYTPAGAGDSSAITGHAHELGHVLFGNPDHRGCGVVGHGDRNASFFEEMKCDRKLLKALMRLA